jgi:hypothetical protein
MKYEKETPWGIAYKLSKNGCSWINFTTLDSGYNEYGGTTDYICDVDFIKDKFQIIETEVLEDDPNWAQAERYKYESYYLNGNEISKSDALEYMKSLQNHFERSSKIDNLIN